MGMTVHPNDRPLSEILKDLVNDLGRLVRGEIALLKVELQENITRLGTGAGLFGGAGVMGLFAFEFLLLALMFGLVAMGLQFWLAALIVGLLLAVIAAVLAMSGKKKVANASLAPAETIAQVKTDAAVIKQDVERLKGR
jgi:uncharacterized membrane protein YqjE